MPVFPSEEWCRWAVSLLTRDPESKDALHGWHGDVGLIVDNEGHALAVLIRAPVDGQLAEPEFLSAPALDDEAPEYWARANASDWSALIDGGLDPIAAIVQGRLKVRGDLSQVIARLRFRGLAERWLTQLRGEG